MNSTKQFTLDSGVYEVHRLRMRDVRGFIDGGDMDALRLAEVAIYKDGQPIGEAVDDLYFDEFTTLIAAVNELNGLGGETGEEGND